MRGTKRMAMSDSPPIFTTSNDTSSKRLSMESPFGGIGAAAAPALPSVQSPPLDKQRAESSRQHVKALNTQFASWVQAQLLNHPDELWEDGLQDYLNHAKSIKDKFSDVVNWLKANAAKGERSSKLQFNDSNGDRSSKLQSNEPVVKFGFESDKNSHKPFLDKPMFPPVATTSPANSWRPLFNSNNNTSSIFGGSQFSFPGSANAALTSNDASNDVDGEDDVEEPSSPSVKKSEEKGILVVHEVQCKVYVKSLDPADEGVWKDKGMGQLTIKCKEGIGKGTKESKPTIIVRNDVGRVVLNALLYPYIKTMKAKNSVMAVFHTSGDGDDNTVVARTFLLKTKNEETTDKLAAAIQEYAPAP